MTYRELKQTLSGLTDKQLDMDVVVSDGCDENGQADFCTVDSITKPGEKVIDAAADGVLEDDQYVLLTCGGIDYETP